MLNRKIIILCVIVCCLSVVSACASDNKKSNSQNNTEETSKEEDANQKQPELTDDFEYLYKEALEGEKIELENETSVQKEYKVEKGEFVKRISEIGNIEYEDLYYESLETNEAADLNFHVTEGSEVKKGDLIATYRPVFNKIDILEQTRDVELMEKEYQAEYNMKKADINLAEYELEELKKDKKSNAKEIEIKKLQIKKLKLLLDKFTETKEPIELARKELNETIRGNEINAIYASQDGYILSIADTSEPEGNFTKGDVIATMTKREKYYIRVDAREEVDGLKYGTEVKIVVEGGHDGKDVEMKGKVVAASNILGADHYYESTIVDIVNEPKDVNWNSPIKVQYEGQLYKDALKVPIEAVMREKSADGNGVEEDEYVYIKSGEAIYKSYINILDENNDYYRVSEGVSEGDTLVCFNK